MNNDSENSLVCTRPGADCLSDHVPVIRKLKTEAEEFRGRQEMPNYDWNYFSQIRKLYTFMVKNAYNDVEIAE